MNTIRVENPFTYSPQNADVSAYNYKRIDPSPFWATGTNYVANRNKKPNSKIKEKEKKIVRNAKSLPKHLLGRYKPPKSIRDKSKDALCFGRGGNGAPLRSKSGRLRSTVYGNPEIRFQANESVQKSISNNIRYSVDREEKSLYHQELEDQIKQKREMQDVLENGDLAESQQLEELEGTQWGKAGPGGAYWRDSAITGQGFFDKMGWATSEDPRRRQFEVKKKEAEDMKREMSEIGKRRAMEHREMNSEIGNELAPLMKNSATGKPRKDPDTGYMMDHSLSSTDVTRLAVSGPQPWHLPSNKHQYSDQLSGQVTEKQDIGARGREMDELQKKQHFESWESFWGRPGYGAPRESVQRENLMKMLHYSYPAVREVPNIVELVTLERLPVR